MGGLDPKQRLAALEAVCTALAHPARRQILLTVHLRGGAMAAGEIAGRFACAWPTTTRHLGILTRAGLLCQERIGRNRVYRIERERLAVVKEWLAWFGDTMEEEGKMSPARTRSSRDPLEMMREICLSLPDTKETPTWGKPHFRVGEKIFSGCGEEHGRVAIGFKLEPEHAREIVKDPRFWPAPYVGHKGWVSMDASAVTDWDEVRRLVHESYRLIAPRRSLARLAAGAGPAAEKAQARPARTARTKPARKASNSTPATNARKSARGPR